MDFEDYLFHYFKQRYQTPDKVEQQLQLFLLGVKYYKCKDWLYNLKLGIVKDERVETFSRFLPGLDSDNDPAVDAQTKLSKDILELYIKLMKCTD